MESGAFWLEKLRDGADTALQAAAAWPWAAGVAIAAAPFILSLAARRTFSAFGSLLCALAALVALAFQTEGAKLAAVAFYVAAMVLAAYGFHDRRRRRELAAAVETMTQADAQVRQFAQILAQRQIDVEESVKGTLAKLNQILDQRRAPPPVPAAGPLPRFAPPAAPAAATATPAPEAHPPAEPAPSRPAE